MAEAATIYIPENVKKFVRAVLLSKIGGVPIRRFSKDYQLLIGENFPMLSLGFNSLLPCLQSMPDVVRIVGDNPRTCTLLGIGDDASFMSGPAIMAQFPVDVKQQKRQRGKQNGGSKKEHVNSNRSHQNCVVKSASEMYPDLVPNLLGLYAVVVKGIHDAYTADEVLKLFSKEAKIVSQSQFNTLSFYRFRDMKEAEQIISKYDGTMVNGTKIGVAPAQEKGHRHAKNNSTDSVSKSSSSHSFDEPTTMEEKHSSSYGHRHAKNNSTDSVSKSSSSHSFDEPTMEEKHSSSYGSAVVEVQSLLTSNHITEKVKSEGTPNSLQSSAEKPRVDKSMEKKDEKRMDKRVDKSGRQNMNKRGNNKNSHRKKNDTDIKKASNQQRNITNERRNNYMPFKNEKQLHEQLEVIGDMLLPQLPHYRVHLDNINKSMNERELIKRFEHFKPVSCRIGKNIASRKYLYADMNFHSLDDIKAISEYLQHNLIMGERIVAYLAIGTIEQLGLNKQAMGLKSSAVTPNATLSSRSTNGEEWNEAGDSTSSPVHPNVTSHQSSTDHHKPDVSMDSMLKTLPEAVNHGVLYASDSEGSTTGARRRRPCILDYLEDETL